MADVNIPDIVDAGASVAETNTDGEGHLTKEKTGPCDSVCTPCVLGDGQTAESTENGSGSKKDCAAAETGESTAIDAHSETALASGVKRKSEDILVIDSSDDVKKARTNEEGSGETPSEENGSGHADKQDDTNGKEADDVTPEICTKTVDDVAKLCGNEDVDAASS